MPRIVRYAIVLGLCVLLTACGSFGPSAHRAEPAHRAGPAHGPGAVLASITAAALAQKSVRATQNYSGLGGVGHYVADVQVASGMERYTFADINGSPPVGRVQIRLVDHTVYVEGNSYGLSVMLQIREGQAKAYVGRWISIPPGDPLYGTFDGLTLSSVVNSNSPFGGRLTAATATSHGTRHLVVQTTGPESSSLTADGTGAPLPIEYAFNGIHSNVGTRFSRWNEPLHVRAPLNSIPITTVRFG